MNTLDDYFFLPPDEIWEIEEIDYYYFNHKDRHDIESLTWLSCLYDNPPIADHFDNES